MTRPFLESVMYPAFQEGNPSVIRRESHLCKQNPTHVDIWGVCIPGDVKYIVVSVLQVQVLTYKSYERLRATHLSSVGSSFLSSLRL